MIGGDSGLEGEGILEQGEGDASLGSQQRGNGVLVMILLED